MWKLSNQPRMRFISYYPLKQGLKHSGCSPGSYCSTAFISYYPLKQGLKLVIFFTIFHLSKIFISYYPLKQGLKQLFFSYKLLTISIYILLSIKTRIETIYFLWDNAFPDFIYILLSIKTRIETCRG